jgi:CO/xanthine dehydrogenase Mo-binding subunit
MIEKLRGFLAEENGCPDSSIEWKGNEGVYLINGQTIKILDAARAFADRNGKFSLSAEGTYKGPESTNPWSDEKFSGDAYKGYSWLATVVELEVDTDTYEANPVHTTAVAEIGQVIHPSLAEGQLAGGILQSLGWAHIEDLSVTAEGRYSASHMSSYLVPTTLDAPGWTIETMGIPCPAGAFGAKGLGELPCDGGAPAFLSALDNALDVFAKKVPATGEYLFNLLEAASPTIDFKW